MVMTTMTKPTMIHDPIFTISLPKELRRDLNNRSIRHAVDLKLITESEAEALHAVAGEVTYDEIMDAIGAPPPHREGKVAALAGRCSAAQKP